MNAASAARRRSVGQAGLEPDPAEHPQRFRVVIPPVDPNEPPVRRPPSSRTISRLKAKAADAARTAEAARALRGQVQAGLKPPAGKLFAVDVAALALCRPAGGLGTSERMARTLAPLAAGGRHSPAVLMAAGAWRDEAAFRAALAGLAPKLTVIGLRICRRKAGLRITKMKTC